jgi:hypothetical protein
VTLPHLDGEIRDGRHHMQVQVYYEDTDFPLRFRFFLQYRKFKLLVVPTGIWKG